MAVYKIFPIADATIYSAYPSTNAGLDEILEVACYNSQNPANLTLNSILANDDIRRTLIKFDSQEISSSIALANKSFSAYLKLYLATANNLSTDYSIEVRQVSQNWEMGTGKLNDVPTTQNGVCWYSTSSYYSGSVNWNSSGYYKTIGGGSWSAISSSQSFNYKSPKDVVADVSTIVRQWNSGSAANNGFLVKLPITVESSSLTYTGLSFFSVDTHTIYPPTLEFRWDDSVYTTGSLSIVQSSDTVVTLANGMGNFKSGTDKYMVRINARDRYPARTFTSNTTSSLYTTVKALPSSSYWSIVDYKTNDIVVDYDTNFTKLSCDSNGNYFYLYMSGLEPERYYKTLIKTVLSTGESIEIDNDLIFKIEN
jgi:hypothetical protein